METMKQSVLQFEYKIMTYYGLMEIAVTHDLLKKDLTSSEDVLNELGKDGWELFTILQEKENSLFIFKRSKWVEKQNEQKLADIDNKFIRMRETKPKDISEFLDRLTTVEQEFLWEHIAKIRDLDKEEQKSHSEILEKQGEQKPADKVEPKFKNGQWIVWKDKCYIVNYNGCGYELIDQNGLSTSLEYGTIDENAHLWDITKDAKSGDLIYVSTEEKGFQAIFDEFDNGIIYFHCSLCIDFTQGGYMPMGDVELVYPLQKSIIKDSFKR